MNGEEIWRDIEGFEGKYQVSSYGRVRNIKYFNRVNFKNDRSCKAIRILKQKLRKNGRMSVHLSDGKDKDFHPQVHRLVAKAFIPNPDNLPEVNHKDENPQNNHVDNLEWCTSDYNIHYGTGLLRSHEAHKKKVAQISIVDGSVIKIWNSSTDAAIGLFGNKDKNKLISACARKNCGRKTAYGYKWKYIENIL